MGLHDTQIARAALALGRGKGFDEPHARQVARLALDLFDQTAELHGLDARARLVLQAASLLHDIGMAISFAKHHKHSMTMVLETVLPGLSPRERALAANVARYHRKKPPSPAHAPFAALTPDDQRAVCMLAALLRVADVLDRAHQNLVRGISLRLRNGTATLTLDAPSGGQPAAAVWRKKSALFESVFDRRIRVRPKE